MKEEIEIWKELPGYESDYQVSNLGRVKSTKRKITIILKQILEKKGYLRVSVYKDKKLRTIRVHQLVAMAFLSHKPDKTHRKVVDHINNIKTDNRLVNLQITNNRHNSSKDVKNKSSRFTGVHWDKKNLKWVSSIKINGKKINLGRFEIEEEAFFTYKKELKNLKLK